MYVTHEQAKKLINDFGELLVIEYEEKLRFLTNLLEDDDWSFIIKSHSLIESLTTELIIARINQEILKPVIERMPLHGEIVSKINVAKSFDLIPNQQRKFVQKISEIRNNIVHKFENINFTLDEYVSGLDKNQKKNWRKTLIWEKMDNGIKQGIEKTIFETPKVALWLALSTFVNDSVQKTTLFKGYETINSESEKTVVQLIKDLENKA